jgi:hypothetical protein
VKAGADSQRSGQSSSSMHSTQGVMGMQSIEEPLSGWLWKRGEGLVGKLRWKKRWFVEQPQSSVCATASSSSATSTLAGNAASTPPTDGESASPTGRECTTKRLVYFKKKPNVQEMVRSAKREENGVVGNLGVGHGPDENFPLLSSPIFLRLSVFVHTNSSIFSWFVFSRVTHTHTHTHTPLRSHTPVHTHTHTHTHTHRAKSTWR